MLSTQELAYLDGLYEENCALLRQLGRIPAPSRSEDRRAAFLEDWLRREGFGTVFTDAQKNVIAEIGCADGGPVVIFAAHTDVVFPITEELPMREEGGRLFAPGIGDDTGNLVNLLMASRWLRRFYPDETGIVLAANSCEEGLGNLDGTKALMQRFEGRTSLFVSFDGYIGQCCSRAVGSHRYLIRIHARGGHSYFDYGAPSAVEQAGRMICDLYGQPLPGPVRTTMNVGTICGGTTVNSIAQDVQMQYEYRSESEENLQRMRAQLRAIVDAHTAAGEQVSLEILGIRPGAREIAGDALRRLTERNRALVAQANGGEVDLAAYSTDSNIPLSMQIPANTVGTVTGGGAHTMDEWISLPDQRRGMRLAAEVIRGVLADRRKEAER